MIGIFVIYLKNEILLEWAYQGTLLECACVFGSFLKSSASEESFYKHHLIHSRDDRS
jgi:hypothetical protein